MLTDLNLRQIQRRDRLYRVADTEGLAIEVPPAGKLRWRYRYRFGGAARMLSLGTYPKVSLAEARRLRDSARKLLTEGIDPSEARQDEKRETVVAALEAADTFEAMAREWMARQQVAEVTANKTRWILETFLIPELGNMPIRDITAPVLLKVLRKAEASGRLESAKRARIKAGQIFRYAILEGRADIDPTSSLRGALKAPKAKHHAAITDPARIGDLLRAIEGFDGQPVTKYALKIAPLVFVRPGELRHATWGEIDFDRRMWRIPAERMKMKAAHLVPMSTQVIALFRELHEITGFGNFVFPGMLSATRPMSENTLNGALRRLGYSGDEMTSHGFRSMAATRLNEMGWRADAIERQLAHAESNKVREAYTHAAQFLDERTEMMQAWADYLDSLREQQPIFIQSIV